MAAKCAPGVGVGSSRKRQAGPAKGVVPQSKKGVGVLIGLLVTNGLLWLVIASGFWLHDHVSAGLSAVVGALLGFGALVAGALAFLACIRDRNGKMSDSSAVVAVVAAGIVLGLPAFVVGRALLPHTICETQAETLVTDCKRCDFVCMDDWQSAGTPRAFYTTSAGKGSSRSTTRHELAALAPTAGNGRFVVWVDAEPSSTGRCVWLVRDSDPDTVVRGHSAGHDQAVAGERVADAAAALASYRNKVVLFVGITNLLAVIGGLIIVHREG